MDRRCAIVARFIDFPPKLGGDKGKYLVRLMHEVRFLPILSGNGQFVPILGVLTKKQAIYITRVFSKGRPPPQNILTSVFAFQEMGFVLWNYCKNLSLYIVLSMLCAISSMRFWISLSCGRPWRSCSTYCFKVTSSCKLSGLGP